MFESILERILQKILGEYLDGFNSSNLNVGILSGEVVIQNVKLKRSALLKLGLPIELRYSLVKSVVMKIPWKSLTSSKIELYLDGVYIVVGTVPENKWELKDERIIEKRKKELTQYAETILKMFIQNQKKEQNKKQEEGFTERIILRIIDNLQVEIKNIHIRIEQPRYSSGITLESFKLTTVNKLGVPEFIDRSKPEHKNEPLRKKLEIKNLGIYNNIGDGSVLSGQETSEKMNLLIGKDKGLKYLILLNFDSKLLQMPKGQTQQPQIKLDLSIDRLQIELENQQIQQLIYFSQSVQKYQRARKKHNSKQLQKEQKQRYIVQFADIYKRYYNRGQKFEGNQQERISQIVSYLDSEEFYPTVKSIVQEAELKKALEQKQTKRFGWISYGKKQLTQQQTKQIQQFIVDNFSQQAKIYKRPIDYGFFKLNILLKQFNIFIGKSQKSFFEGVNVKLTDLAVGFNKRSEGMDVKVELTNLSIDLVENSFISQQTLSTNFFSKQSEDVNIKYIDMVFSTCPPNQSHLDTKINGMIQPSVIYYNPMFIKRVTQFAKLHINDENAQLALEKYNEIKDKTSEAIDESLATKKDTPIIGVDATINAPLIIIPFLKKPDHCWGIQMGLLRFITDKEIINPQIKKETIQIQRYLLKLEGLNVGWYQNKDLLLKQYQKKTISMKHQIILKNFSLDLIIQLCKKDILQTPSIKIRGELPHFHLNLSQFTYKMALSMTQNPPSEGKTTQTMIPGSEGAKQEIIRQSEKKDIIYYLNPTSKLWDRYIGILKGNYIYLFESKNSQSYDKYVYLKNSLVQIQEPGKVGREFAIKIKNKINNCTIAFSKQQSLKEWIRIIQGKKVLQEVNQELKKQLSNKINPNKMKVSIQFSILSLGMKVYSQEKQWMDIAFNALLIKVSLFEYRKQIQLSLKGMTFDDTTENYINPNSDYLIKSGQKNGQFVDIRVHQKQSKDPGYQHIVNDVEISFGMLWVNLKPPVIKKLMQFFIPPKINQKDKLDDSIHSISTDVSTTTNVAATEQKIQENKIFVRIKFQVEEISLSLINTSTKVRLSTISVKKLQFRMEQSLSGLQLKGILSDLNVTEETNFPNTIISQAEATKVNYLVKTHNVTHQQLLGIQIRLLKQKNQDGKDILVKVTVKQLQVNYFQQPVLRILDFLTLDFLPSIKQTEQPKIIQEQKMDNQSIKPPEISSIDIEVNVLNSIVMLKPDQQTKDGFKLQISKVNVRNSSTWSSEYGIQKVLLEDYIIQIKEVTMTRQFKQVTNNMDINLRVHLIQNPLYYKSKFKQFKSVMKIECDMTSFLARVNNTGYNFIMKILNHNISYNDNCDQFFYPDKGFLIEEGKDKQLIVGDPIDFKLSIKAITLVVADQVFPASNIGIKDLKVSFLGSPSQTQILVTINDIYGGYFQEKQGKFMLIPMINTARIQQRVTYQKNQMIEMNDLVTLLHHMTDSRNPVDDVIVNIKMTPNGDKNINLRLQSLFIDLKLRPLLKLSKIVNTSKDIQAPSPKHKPPAFLNKPPPGIQSAMRLGVILSNIKIRGGSDETRRQAILISTEFIHIDMDVPAELTSKQVKLRKNENAQKYITSGKLELNVNNFQISLVETLGLKEKKRVLLKPLCISMLKSGEYNVVQDKCVLKQDAQINVTSVTLEATTRDMLKLNVLYSTNMAIFKEQSSNEAQKPKIQNSQEVVQRTDTIARLQQMALKEEIIKDMKASIQVKSFNLKILHHSDELVLPVLMMDLHELNPIYRSNILVDQFSLILHTQFNYFNPRSSQWEPIFEKMGIHVQHVTTHKDTGDESLLIVQNIEDVGLDELHINISSQFLTSLSEIINLNKKQKDKIQKNLEEDQKVQVSPFVLQNMTLNDIQILIPGDKKQNQEDLGKNDSKITIKSREKKPIVVPLQQTQLVVIIEQKQHTINIASIGKRMIPDSDCIVDCQIQKLFKIIVIANNTIIQNKTTKPVYVKSQTGQPVQIQPGNHISLSNCEAIAFGHQVQQMSGLQNINDMILKNSINFKAGRLFINVSKQQFVSETRKLTTFVIEAPIKLINLLPYSMLYQVIINNETKATKSLDSMKEYEIYRHKKANQMEIKINLPGFYWSHSINLQKINQCGTKLQKVVLKDQDLNQSLINVFIQIDTQTQSINIIFFSSGYIVNDTPFDFFCYGNFNEKDKKKFYPLAGQQEIQSGAKIDTSTIIFGSDLGKKIRFAQRETPDSYSGQIQVAGIGSTQFEIMIRQNIRGKLQDTYMVCVVNRSLRTMLKTISIQKQVRITPKHVIQNKTDKTITIHQNGAASFYELPPQEKQILFFLSKNNHKIQIKTQNSENSCDLDVDSFGLVNFYVNSGQLKLNFKMNISSQDDYTYVVFQTLEEKQIPYRIKNNIKGLSAKASIIDGPINYGEEIAFLWKNPAEKRSFSLQLKYQKSETIQTLDVHPDEVAVSHRRSLKLPKSILNIKVSIVMTNDKKIVLIEEDDKSETQSSPKILSTMHLSMKKIGLSLIMNHSKISKPYEAIFISLHQLQFIKQTTPIDQTYQARMRFFQIDQNNPHLMVHPVIVTPQKFKYYMGKNKSAEDRYIINTLIKKDTRVQNSTVLKTIAVQFDNISVKISDLFIRLLLEVFSEFQDVMAIHQEFSIVRKKDDWKKIEMKSDNKPIFIQQIMISPFEIQISLRLKQQNAGKSKMKLPYENLISAFGINFINIEDAPIHLSGIKIQNCFDSLDGIKSKIIQNYKWGVLRQFYKIIGAVDIIGNPISLFKNISTGLTDMVQKPAEGLVKGPLQLGRGIAEGGYSLIAHTIGGVLNSLDKMTGAVSTGLAFLCFDPQFDQKRQKQKNKKPKNLLQGLQKGAKAIFVGFKQGITGIFLKPYENAEKDGFLGFLKGTYQGLSGVVIKPVTGIIDFASKTMQGLKNTVMFFEDKPNQSRMRCPRPFYGQNSLLKQYNPLDSQILNVLQFVKKGKFAECKFINVYIVEKYNKQIEAIVILDQYVINLSFEKKKVHWYIQMNNIAKIDKNQGETLVRMHLKRKTKYIQTMSAVIQSEDSNQIRAIYSSLEQRLEKINCYINM